MRADLVPGALFPDYELPDHRGKHRKLSELLPDAARDPRSAARAWVSRSSPGSHRCAPAHDYDRPVVRKRALVVTGTAKR
jgi:hypothetical protein